MRDTQNICRHSKEKKIREKDQLHEISELFDFSIEVELNVDGKCGAL